MSHYSALPAEQSSLHIGVSRDGYQTDSTSVDDTLRSDETTGPPPSYSETSTLVHSDVDAKHQVMEPSRNLSLSDSPAQLPFDDLLGGSSAHPARQSLPTLPQQQEHSPRMAHATEIRPSFMRATDSPNPPQQAPASFPQPRSRPELPHASRSTPDHRGKLGQITEFEEADPYGHKFRDGSTFDATRRAQRVDSGKAAESPSPRGQVHVNGRIPSIKPGEIMPIDFIRSIIGRPNFFPPPEAPPFPPTIHNPIRAAHFPSNVDPVVQPELARASSHRYPIPPQPAQPSRHHSHRASQPAAPPPNQTRSYSQEHLPVPPPSGLPRSISHQNTPPTPPLQPLRSNSYQQASPISEREYPPAPRRHTLNMRDGVPPGLAPNGPYPSPSSVPYPQSQPYPHPPSPSRTPSHHQDNEPPPPPPRSSLRVSYRQPLPEANPQAQFIPRNLSPVRLPSQNVPTPQLFGVVHTPPTPSASPRPDPSRPPRSTPKPVMPEPLAAREHNFGRGGTGPLQRSASAAVTSEKGGFLSKTKSILRKRSSAAGIKTHVDGAISYAPMPNLPEESGTMGKLGKKLSRRK